MPDADADEVRRELVAHNQDPDAHNLAEVESRLATLEGTAGIWAVAARDSFSGADGPLTQTDTGQPWLAWLPPNLPYHMGGKCVTPDGGTRGAIIEDTFANGQIEADLAPGNSVAGLYFRYKDAVNHMFASRLQDGFGISRQVDDISTSLFPSIFIPYTPGERLKVRFIGPTIWLFRIFGGLEEQVAVVQDQHWIDQTRYGVRVTGTASADNFRLLSREGL